MAASTTRKAEDGESPRAGKRPRLSDEQPGEKLANVARTDSFSDGWFGSEIDLDDEALQAVDNYDVFQPSSGARRGTHSANDPFLDDNPEEEEVPSSQGEADASNKYTITEINDHYPSSQSELRDASPTVGAFKRASSRNFATLGPPISSPAFSIEPDALPGRPISPSVGADDEDVLGKGVDIDFGAYVPIPAAVGFASYDSVLSDPSLPVFVPASQVPIADSELASTSSIPKPTAKSKVKLAGGGPAIKPITVEDIRLSANKLMNYQLDTKWKPQAKARNMPPPITPARSKPKPTASVPAVDEDINLQEREGEDENENIDFGALVRPSLGFIPAANVSYDDEMPTFMPASQVPIDRSELASTGVSTKPARKSDIQLAGGAGGLKPLTEGEIKASAEKLMAYQQDTKWKPQGRTRLPRLASGSRAASTQAGLSSSSKSDILDMDDSGVGLLEPVDRPDVMVNLKGKGKQQFDLTSHGDGQSDAHKPTDVVPSDSAVGRAIPTPSRPSGNPFSSRIQLAGTPARSNVTPFKTPVRPLPASRPSVQTPLETSAQPPLFSQSNSPVVSQNASSTLYRLGLSQRKPKAKGSGFTTPFKPGMAPGEKGRETLLGTPVRTAGVLTPLRGATPLKNGVNGASSAKPGISGITRALEAEKERQTLERAVFDIRPKAGRMTLRQAGFEPPKNQQTATTIPYLSLKTASRFSFPQGGHAEMLTALRVRGCTLADKDWVINHWGQVIWKISGLARTGAPGAKDKWNWEEALRQMLYRYEREVNRAERPAIRRIQERDASAAQSMVLCVSDVQTGADEGVELELTDGWYCIRASADKSLARAVRKGKLVVGRKIAVAGARLEGGHEGKEVLKAYRSSTLKITGNSTSLARWDARLGFQRHPFVASLRSLSADGGSVALLDVTITKLFPIGFVETDASGRSSRPFDQSAEDEAQRAWEERRTNEASKWRIQLEKRLERMRAAVDRLSYAAKGTIPNTEESPPGHTESFLEEFEDAEYDLDMLKGQKFDHVSAAWLADAIQTKCNEEYEKQDEGMERELASACPPRKVRNFRVVAIKDAQSLQNPTNRTAQLTVWDVLAFGTDPLRVDQRYLLSNVQPSQPGSWRKGDSPGDIYLSTRRDTKWTAISET